jgi:hypothetical protein
MESASITVMRTWLASIWYFSKIAYSLLAHQLTLADFPCASPGVAVCRVYSNPLNEFLNSRMSSTAFIAASFSPDYIAKTTRYDSEN